MSSKIITENYLCIYQKKYVKIQPTLQIAIFQNKYIFKDTILHIWLRTKSLLLMNNIYLVLCSLEMQGRLIKTNAYCKLFYLV